MPHFSTDERRLEQFLFAHFIRFDFQSKDDRGHTTWHYADTPWLRQVVAEYRQLCQRFDGQKEVAHG